MPDDVRLALAEINRRRARKDPIFFIREYLMTYDPRPTAIQAHMDFDLYDFQESYVHELIAAIRQGYDAFIEKSRDMGISWVTLAVILWCFFYDESFQALLGSRKEEYVDNWTMDSLFGKLEYLIKRIKDPLLLPKGFSLKKHRTFLKLVNPANNNAIKGESANSDFGRSGRYTIAMIDEGGFWPDFERSWTAVGESTKCRILITTPPDRPSYAKFIRFSEKIKVLTYLWRLHPDKDDAWYNRQRDRKSEKEMLHEIDISWEYSASGRPYAEVDKVEFGHFPYDPSLPLYLSLDLGRDAVAIGWWQPVRNSHWLTLVDAYENTDKLIDWYVPFFGGPINTDFIYTDDDLNFIEMIKYWRKPICYGDPSGRSRHIESERSPYKILKDDYNIVVNSNTFSNDYQTRRDETKRMLMHVRVNDKPGTRYWQTAVSSAHYPEKSETSQSTGIIVKPVHDWTSHHRTQTEFMAVNYKTPEKEIKQPPPRKPMNFMPS